MRNYYRDKYAYNFFDHGFQEPFKMKKPSQIEIETEKYQLKKRNLTTKAALSTMDKRPAGYKAMDGNTYNSYIEFRKNS